MTAWADLTWPQVADTIRQRPVAILPVGSVEEHGFHLPLATDTIAANAFVERIAEDAQLLRLPALPYGQVWSLQNFPGSLTISDDTLVRIILELAEGLAQDGVRGLVLFSAHLGNANALKQASRRLAEQGGLPCLPLTYPGLDEAAKKVNTSPLSHPAIVHSDEIETSILLALAPDVVDMSEAVSEYPLYPPDFDAAPMRWDAVCSSGVFGDATAATAEKGDVIVSQVIATAVSAITAWRDRLSL